VGCVGVVPHGEECELHRMYLLAAHRGQGLGRRLLETAMAFGRECGCRRMRAWSDVKLRLAHRLYYQCGFVRQGDRICDDPDQSHEYGFVKEPL
jgi:putative acetyltransferase